MKAILILAVLAMAWRAQAQTNSMTAQGALLDTAEKAENAVIQSGAKGDLRVPLRAQDRNKAAGLFRLGRACDGLGKPGDRIWQVQFVDFNDQVVRLIWVNAENGNLRLVFPIEADNGAEKADREAVRDIANKAYWEATGFAILAEEGPTIGEEFVLGRDVEGLGKTDDKVVEVWFIDFRFI